MCIQELGAVEFHTKPLRLIMKDFFKTYTVYIIWLRRFETDQKYGRKEILVFWEQIRKKQDPQIRWQMLRETETPSTIICVQLCAHAAPFWEPQTQFTVKHNPLTPTALHCNTPLANYIAGGLLVPLKWSLCRPLEWLQLKLKAIGYWDGKKQTKKKVLKWRPKGQSRLIFQNRGVDGALWTHLCVLVLCPLLTAWTSHWIL